jgi:hypothetical protein
MAMKREISVGFKGPGGTIETRSFLVPAEDIQGNRDVFAELMENEKLNTRLFVKPSDVVWAEIGDPFDDTQRGSRVHFG